jgi:flagellar motor switch protein FliG
MSVYIRFKRDPEGLRKLVELLESTPAVRRQRMIGVGMNEDAAYTEQALKLVMTFEDVMNLPDVELAELIAVAPTRITGSAIAKSKPEVQQRFLRNAVGGKGGEIRDIMESPTITLSEVGGAQLKLIAVARSLEKKGLIKTKQIPQGTALSR